MNETHLKKEGKLPFKVSKEVVGYLSQGLYRNFARAVKELISNSYDAKAKEVKIKLDLTNAKVIIKDNGHGMNIKELENNFLNIGHPTPYTEKVNNLGRKRIGTFGIGCVSVFPYCSKLQIITKKRHSEDIIELNINTEQFFREGTFLLQEAEIDYKIYESDLPKGKGETIISLESIKPHMIKELKQNYKRKSNIDKLGGYLKFKWTLSQYAPILFSPKRKEIKRFFEEPNKIHMKLWLDGEELFRNIPDGVVILEKGKQNFNKILVKYTIMTPQKPVEPEEARGLQIRLRDVAIGLPTDFDVIKLTGKVLGKLNYLCGEIHILKGLESSLMVDRDSFSYTQEVAELHEFFRKKLIKWSNQLEDWARSDKEVYEILQDIEGSDKIINELKNADIIHLSKERLRISKKQTITQKKKGKIASPTKKIKEVLTKKEGYKVQISSKKISAKAPPIKVIPKERNIIIYEEHPEFIEKLKFNNNIFKVSYDEWSSEKTPYSICKLLVNKNEVIFNSSHPLFESNLNDEIVKKLSLGIILITRNRNNEKDLVTKLNHLIEDIFLVK